MIFEWINGPFIKIPLPLQNESLFYLQISSYIILLRACVFFQFTIAMKLFVRNYFIYPQAIL